MSLLKVVGVAVLVVGSGLVGYHAGEVKALSQVPVIESLDKAVHDLRGSTLYCLDLESGASPCVVYTHNPKNSKMVLLVPKSMLEDPTPSPKDTGPGSN